MNLGKLSKRLRKELLANPKQAAVLAIACLVACWFWSPLLMKWLGGKGKGKAQAAKAEPTAAVETVAAKAEPERPWFDIQRWRLADPLTRSAALVDTAKNPFRAPTPETVDKPEKEEDEQTASTQTAALQPGKLNLSLEAILYGGSRRLAQINGQTVRENEEFSIDGKAESATEEEANRSSPMMARVTAIYPTEVLVEVAGQSLRLSLQPKLLGRGDVVKRLRQE